MKKLDEKRFVWCCNYERGRGVDYDRCSARSKHPMTHENALKALNDHEVQSGRSHYCTITELEPKYLAKLKRELTMRKKARSVKMAQRKVNRRKLYEKLKKEFEK